MTTPHLHLVLNHVPTIGTAIGVVLLVLSFLRKNEGLRRVSFELFFVVGLLTLPAYLSGVGTQAALETRGDVIGPSFARHHDAALFASLFMMLTGGLAWLCLWQTRRTGQAWNGTLGLLLVVAAVTLATMARTATLGGEITHEEMWADPEAAAVAAEEPATTWFLSASVIAQFVTGYTWVWPTAEALHFIGLWLLFGVVLLVNLRLLGVLKKASFAAVHRLLPWALLGLGVNAITGMMFVLAAPEQYVENTAFFWKMGLLLIAGLDLLYLTVFDAPWAVREGEEAPASEKALAAGALMAWVGVMYFGRMLPFIGNAF
jgi:uncharacterized membrane protein